MSTDLNDSDWCDSLDDADGSDWASHLSGPDDDAFEATESGSSSVDEHVYESIVDDTLSKPQKRISDFAEFDVEDSCNFTTSKKVAEDSEPCALKNDQKPDTVKHDETIQRYAFLYAIETHDLDLLQYLLEKGMPTDIALANGQTPLLYAAQQDDQKLVELLLAYGAWPFYGGSIPTVSRHIDSYSGEECPFEEEEKLPTPFQIAAQSADSESSKAILRRAIEIKIAKQAELISIGEAPEYCDDYEIAKLDWEGNQTRIGTFSVLELAVFLGSESLVRTAIEAKFDVFGTFDRHREYSVIYPEMDCDEVPDKLLELALRGKNFVIARLLIETRQQRLANPDSKTSMLDSNERRMLLLKIDEDIERVRVAEEKEGAFQALRKERELDPYRPRKQPDPINFLDDEIPF